MSGHFICDRCGYDGGHADYCVYLRPASEQWRGHRSKEEMDKLKERQSSRDVVDPTAERSLISMRIHAKHIAAAHQ